jgi:hypothetical protein
MHLFTTWPQIAANGAAKIPFKKLLVEIAGARLATEISVQFAFNSSDARLKVKGSSVKAESASCRILEV